MKDWIYSSICATSRQVCPEICPCTIVTAYSKTSNHKEKNIMGFIQILPPPSSTTWARSKEGCKDLSQPWLTHWVLRGDSSPAAIQVHCVGTCSWQGSTTPCGVVLWLLREWHVHSLPHPTCLAQPIPLLVLPSFHLSWGCFTLPSQRAFCCQSWQDWLEGYSSAGAFPGPWAWAKTGLTLHRVETNPTSTDLSSDLCAGGNT